MVMGTNAETASFNQAQFQMIRIHEVLLRIDRLSIAPLMFNAEFRLHNYQIIFHDLCSLLVTISSKLEKLERQQVFEHRALLRDVIQESSVFKVKHGAMKSKRTIWDMNAWDKLQECLFAFRMEIELLMDSHGFSNPSKGDPTRAVVSN